MPSIRGLKLLGIAAIWIFANSILLSAQSGSVYLVPAGTKIALKMDTEVNSASASVNDTFIAYSTNPVVVRGVPVLPAQAIFEARITSVKRASAGTDGSINFSFESLRTGSVAIKIHSEVTSELRTRSSSRFRLLSIFGGAAAGAIAGGIARSASGAIIGAGIGAGAGTGVSLLRKGKAARLKKDAEIVIELKKDLQLPVLDY